MDNFLPLTILGAIIGIYTILPEYKKLRLGYSFGILDKLIIIIIIMVMLSLLIFGSYISYNTDLTTSFYSILKQNSFNIVLNANTPLMITESFHYQFIIDIINVVSILILFIFFLSKFRTNKIRINNQKYFIDKIDELFYKGEYNTVISLIDDNYKNIMKYEKVFYKNTLFKDIEQLINPPENVKTQNVAKSSLFDILIIKINIIIKKENYNNFYQKIMTKISIIYNKISFYKDNNKLREDIEIRLLDRNYIKNIVKYNPYFGLKIITDKIIHSDFREKFAHSYFEELMKNKNSVLYREIMNTVWFKSGYRYEISSNNKILHQVLFNVDMAYETTVYKPIGDLTLELLQKQHKKPHDFYNDYNAKLMENSSERLNNPLFMAIHFFDIMIREAIYQKINWHMWLYYYDIIVEEICKNYELTENSEPEYEFPNVYSFLLSEIIHNLIEWIKLIEIDTENVYSKLNTLDCEYQNDNIIKSSIISLKYCIEYILSSEGIPNNFKLYLLEIIFYFYFDLALNDKEIVNNYGIVLEKCLLETAKENSDSKESFNRALNSIPAYKLSIKSNFFAKFDETKKKFQRVN